MRITPEMFVAIINCVGYIVITIFSILVSNRLISYKVETLQMNFEEMKQKVENHNKVQERTTALENDIETVWNRYDDMTKRIDRAEKRQNDQYDKIIELITNK